MTPEERDAFLAVPRLCMLSTLREDGAPVTVPVWFEWDGAVVRMFAGAGSGKIKRVKRDSRATIVVANAVGEPEAWVAFDGRINVKNQGAGELAERLAHRYWDMSDAAHVATVKGWRDNAAALRLLEMTPRAIRTSTG